MDHEEFTSTGGELLIEGGEVKSLQCNIFSLGVHDLQHRLHFRIKVCTCAQTRDCDVAVLLLREAALSAVQISFLLKLLCAVISVVDWAESRE